MENKKCINASGVVVSENWDNFTELAADIANDQNLSLKFLRDESGLMTVKAEVLNSTYYKSSGQAEEWAYFSHYEDNDKAINDISKEIVESYLAEEYFIED